MHLLDRSKIVRAGRDGDAGQQHGQRHVVDTGRLLHHVLAGEIIAAGGRRPKRVEVLGDFFQRMLFTETIVGEALDAHEGSPTYRADVRVRGVTVVTARVPRSETRATLRKSLFFSRKQGDFPEKQGRD